MGNRLMVRSWIKIPPGLQTILLIFPFKILTSRKNTPFLITFSFHWQSTDSITDHTSFFVKSPFLKIVDFCYKPSGFQPSKMFGFDFHTYLTDMLVSNGNLQFLWRSLPKDRWKKQFRFWTDRLISVWGELISTKKDPYQAKHPKANLLFHEGIPHPTYLAPSRSSSHVILMS